MEYPFIIERWLHFTAGILWVGMLYYFNFVQVPAITAASADNNGPGPAAIMKYITPRALFWFRWTSIVTWLSGAALLTSRINLVLSIPLLYYMDAQSHGGF